MRKRLRKRMNFGALVEQFARQLVELADEEQRLAETLRNLRRVKARVVVELATTVRDAQK